MSQIVNDVLAPAPDSVSTTHIVNETVRVEDMDAEASTAGQVPTSQGDGSVLWDDAGGSGTSNEVHVDDYGAEGDGVTDDSVAINAAIAAITALGGGVVNFGAKTYAFSTVINTGSAVLRGVGWITKLLRLNDIAPDSIVLAQDGGLEDLTIDIGGTSGATNVVVQCSGSVAIKLKNISIEAAAASGGTGLDLYQAQQFRLEHVRVIGFDIGVNALNGNKNVVDGLVIIACDVGLKLAGTNEADFIGVNINGCTTAIEADALDRVVIRGKIDTCTNGITELSACIDTYYHILEYSVTTPITKFAGSTSRYFALDEFAKIAVYNVKDYGAVGDGVADDTAAITAAISAAASGSIAGVVYLPLGDYAISSTLSLSSGGLTLQGDGPANTRILAVGLAGPIGLVDITGSNCGVRDLEINYLAENGSGTGTGGYCILNYSATITRLENCYFKNAASGIYIGDASGSVFRNLKFTDCIDFSLTIASGTELNVENIFVSGSTNCLSMSNCTRVRASNITLVASAGASNGGLTLNTVIQSSFTGIFVSGGLFPVTVNASLNCYFQMVIIDPASGTNEPLTVIACVGCHFDIVASDVNNQPYAIDVSGATLETTYAVTCSNAMIATDPTVNVVGVIDRRIESVNFEVTPEMFGAVGDGSTNDSAAFTAMFTAFGGSLRKRRCILRGVYFLDTAGLVFPSNWEFIGVPIFSAAPGFKIDGESLSLVYTENTTFKNITVVMADANTAYGFNLQYSFGCLFENIKFVPETTSFAAEAIYIVNCEALAGAESPIIFKNIQIRNCQKSSGSIYAGTSDSLHFVDVFLTGCLSGIAFNDVSEFSISRVKVYLDGLSGSVNGLSFTSCTHGVVSDAKVIGNAGTDVYVSLCQHLIISDLNAASSLPTYGLHVIQSQYTIITGIVYGIIKTESSCAETVISVINNYTQVADIGWSNNATFKRLNDQPCIVIPAADYQVVLNDEGKTFSNQGDGVTRTFTLPPNSASLKQGFRVRFRRVAAHDVIIDSGGGTIVYGTLSNDDVTLTSVGDIELEWDATSQWMVLSLTASQTGLV